MEGEAVLGDLEDLDALGQVASAGGYRILDKHVFPKGVENCDYRFGDDVFIELKILGKDSFETPERQDKLMAFFKVLGLTDDTGVFDVDSNQLAPAAKKRLYEIVYSNLDPLIKKANRQIKATAQHLGVAKFQGVIFLVNQECETIEPGPLRNYVSYLIHRKKCSSLHHAITFSAIPAIAPGSKPVIGVRTGPADAALGAIYDRISAALKEKVQEVLGKTLGDAPPELGPFTNLRDHRSFTKGGATITLVSQSRAAIDKNLDFMKRRAGP